MVRVETSTNRRAGVTFVTTRVTNTRSTPQSVRMQSTVDGPMWQPRTGSGQSPEWSGDTWEATILPGQTRGMGFATPVEPTGSPTEIVSVSRMENHEQTTRNEEVLAELDEWSPPSGILTDDQ